MTRRRLVAEEVCLIYKVEPKDVVEACKDDNLIRAMEEELDQIGKNNTWELVPRLKDKNVIGTKWVFRKKLNEASEVVRNKTKLVQKGQSQQEGIDYEKTFSLVARIEAVRLLLSYAAYKDFKVYQMHVKSTILNGDLEEEVYIEQPDGFSLLDDRDMVCKLKKTLLWIEKSSQSLVCQIRQILVEIRIY